MTLNSLLSQRSTPDPLVSTFQVPKVQVYTATALDCRPSGSQSEDAQPHGAGQEAKCVDAHFTGEENAWRLEVATQETAGSSAFCPESESEPGCLHQISSHFLLCEPTLTTEPLCAHLSDCSMEVVRMNWVSAPGCLAHCVVCVTTTPSGQLLSVVWFAWVTIAVLPWREATLGAEGHIHSGLSESFPGASVPPRFPFPRLLQQGNQGSQPCSLLSL